MKTYPELDKLDSEREERFYEVEIATAKGLSKAYVKAKNSEEMEIKIEEYLECDISKLQKIHNVREIYAAEYVINKKKELENELHNFLAGKESEFTIGRDTAWALETYLQNEMENVLLKVLDWRKREEGVQ